MSNFDEVLEYQRDINSNTNFELANINKKLDNHITHIQSKIDMIEKVILVEMILIMILNPITAPILIKLIGW